MEEKNIRVLLVAALPPPPGGDSTWAEGYLSYSKIHNFNVDVVNTAMIGKRSENANDSYMLIDEIKRSFLIWKGIWSSLRRYKPNVVHMNTNCSPKGLIRDYISSCIVRIYKVPLIIHCHTNVGFKLKDSSVGQLYLRKLLINSQTVIVLNNTSYNYVVDKVKTPTVIIPNFIPKDYISVEKKEISDGIRNIVFVGHVKKEKGINELLNAAKHFKKITFYIVGPVTEHYQGFIPEPNIKMMGAVSAEEVKGFLMKCDVFLLPTYSEGFSVALLEAMATGIPVIATNVGANYDMLENKGGIIVEPLSTNEIIQAVYNIRDKSIRQKMSEWNINKVRNCYTLDTVIQQLRELYVKLIDDRIENKSV